MSINYIIATYSGKIPSRTEYFAGKELQIHLQALVNIFEMKRITKRKNYISNVTVIMPTDVVNVYPNYYRQDYWLKYFKENFPATANGVDICINFIEQIGENKYFSYDQWIQGTNITTNYHIFIEDDWIPDNICFDEELIIIYKNKFPVTAKGTVGTTVESVGNIGYLCQLFSMTDTKYKHTAISNGIISSDSISRLGKNWKENMIKIKEKNPQLQFSLSLNEKKIPIMDTTENYNTPFWRAYQESMDFYTNKSKNLFVPIQYYLKDY